MEELLKVIANFWNGDDCAEARSIIRGGLWLDSAEERVTKPYGAFTAGKSDIEHSTLSRRETVMLTFTFYVDDNECAKAAQVASAFKKAFLLFDTSTAARQWIAPDGYTGRVESAFFRGETIPQRLTEELWAVDVDFDITYVETKV